MECVLCGKSSPPESVVSRRVRSNIQRFNDEWFGVWKCPSCACIHAAESVDLPHYYAGYPNHSQKADLVARICFRKHLRRMKENGLRKADRILDFGCGHGNFVSFLKQQGYANCTGYDRYNPTFEREPEDEYDFIFCNEVLEHVDDPAALVETLTSLCRAGGTVFIGTPNADSVDLGGPERYWNQLHQPYHRHLLSRQALDLLAARFSLQLKRGYFRYYADTLLPFLNEECGLELIYRNGNCLDIVFNPNPRRIGKHLTSPVVWFKAFFGYFLNRKTTLEMFYQLR